MKTLQLAEMLLSNGEKIFLNTEYITSYGYIKEQDKTFVSVLGEKDERYFVGDQTQEIKFSFNCIRR